MSPTPMDRTFRSFSGRHFRKDIATCPVRFSEMIAEALRRDFGDTHAAVKTVSKQTGANERAVKNWFEAKNSPAGYRLIALMSVSEAVLEAVLVAAGRRDLFTGKKLIDSKHELMKMLWAIHDLEFEQLKTDYPDRLTSVAMLSLQWEAPMPDPANVIVTAIHSAFVKHPMEDDPDFSPQWIKPDECAHLAKVILMELEANGLEIVKKAT